MSGLRILYVPPRLAGRVSNWSGRDTPDGRSWLVDHAASMNFNAIWFSPMHVTTQVSKADGNTGSLYGIRSHWALDAEFSATPDPAIDRTKPQTPTMGLINGLDASHLRHFTGYAAQRGVLVLADAVLNHLAADHETVVSEMRAIRQLTDAAAAQGQPLQRIYHGQTGTLIGLALPKSLVPAVTGPLLADLQESPHHRTSAGEPMQEVFFRFRLGDNLAPYVDGAMGDQWTDVLKINYRSPAAQRYFIEDERTGRPGYWKRWMSMCLDLGYSGFRCDAAYAVDPEAWNSLMTHAYHRKPDVVFLGENLGGPYDKIVKMADARAPDGRSGFTMGMNTPTVFHQRKVDEWVQAEAHLVNSVSRFGGAASLDNQDTPHTITSHYRHIYGGWPEEDKLVRQSVLRDLALATLMGNSFIMQLGTEYLREKQNHVFAGNSTPQEWAALLADRAAPTHPLNLTQEIATLNSYKAGLGVENCRASLIDRELIHQGRGAQLAIIYQDVETGQTRHQLRLTLNMQPEQGPLPGCGTEVFSVSDGTGRPALRSRPTLKGPVPVV